MTSRVLIALQGLLGFLACLPAADRQKSTVATILPQIGQRGTAVEVWMEGSHLETAEEVLFYRPGIRCTGIAPLTEIPRGRDGRLFKVEPGRAIKLTFEIAKDAPLGEYFLRVRTHKKLSELLTFWVTPYPVVDELHPYEDKPDTGNASAERAQMVPLNSTIVGYQAQGPPNDIDCYLVELSKGQLCTAQILSARLGTHHYGGLTDMAIEVNAPSGKRMARGDDSPLLDQDPVVSFRAEEAGPHLITVRQQMDSEEPLRHYALHIGEFARPVVTYPLGGRIGQKRDLSVRFADGTAGRIEVQLPSTVGPWEASLVPLDEVADLAHPLPSPNRLRVADFPDVMEQEGHGKPDNPQQVTESLPFGVNGVIKKAGEQDWYRFTANKGERYKVRAYARTLGSPLDPTVWIRPAEGNPSKRTYEEDDSTWDALDWEGSARAHQIKDRLDSIFMFEPDEDGDYLLGIGDTRREFGEDYVYRVEIQPQRDQIFTYYPPYPSQSEIVRDVIGVHRGSTFARTIAIQHGFGSRYDGPIRLEARGLPKEIQFECPTITKKDSIILATFTAAKDADLKAGIFELVPHALDKGAALRGAFAQTSAATDRRGGFAMVFNKTRHLAFAILEEARFDVSIEQPRIGLAKNAEIELKVAVRRKGDFKEALYLEMDWLPAGVTKAPPLVIEAGEEVGYYKLSATGRATVGKYRLSITAREYKGGNPGTGVGFHYVASPMISLEVVDPYFTIDLDRAAIPQGERGELIGRINHLRPFPGEATAKLLRLPNGVSLVGNPKITTGQETVSFTLQVDPDALTGQYKDIACDLAITEAGQEIHQQSGSGVLRIDTKRP